MSKAYRKWKENLKSQKRLGKPQLWAYREIFDWIEIQRKPCTMREFRKDKRRRQMESKKKKKPYTPAFALQMLCDPSTNQG